MNLVIRPSWAFATSLLFFVVLSGCTAKPEVRKKIAIGWRPIETFTGDGSEATESFEIESTQWRIRWEAKETSPGKGALLVMVHSAVSGRPITLGLDHKGPGKGIALITEDPRLYFLDIKSEGAKWSLSVDEAVSGEVDDIPLKAR